MPSGASSMAPADGLPAEGGVISETVFFCLQTG